MMMTIIIIVFVLSQSLGVVKHFKLYTLCDFGLEDDRMSMTLNTFRGKDEFQFRCVLCNGFSKNDHFPHQSVSNLFIFIKVHSLFS